MAATTMQPRFPFTLFCRNAGCSAVLGVYSDTELRPGVEGSPSIKERTCIYCPQCGAPTRWKPIVKKELTKPGEI